MRQSVTGVESERQTFANEIRRRRPKPGRKWHLDEVRVETYWRGELERGELWIKMATYTMSKCHVVAAKQQPKSS